MKVALTARGTDLESEIDERFGRSRYFVIYDTETKQSEAFDNSDNLNASQGAGTRAAEKIAKLGAGALITGHCGPKAFQALKSSGIEVYNTEASTVKQALELYLEGKLTEANNADVEGHWS